MKQRTAALWVSFAGAFALLAPCAQASIITFDFNSLVDGNNNTKVQQYMNGVITSAHPGGSVKVTGSVTEANYTGDNHVVGPVVANKATAETLGTSDGGVHHGGKFDSFLVNTSNTDRITMLFSFPVYSASFDYEIFPNGKCPQSSKNCTPALATWPDFTFTADGTLQFRTLGVLPGDAGTFPHSPVSGIVNTEKAPQFIDESGVWKFPKGVTKVEFIDWPQMIGIDNLKVDDAPPVPEPASLFLLGSGLLGLLGFDPSKRFRK